MHVEDRLVVAFDPGGTTGVAVGIHSRSPDFSFSLLESSEVFWVDRYLVYDIIEGYSKRDCTISVVAEDFKPAPHAIQALAQRHVLASEVLGMIDLACKRLEVQFSRQPPSVRKSVRILNEHKEVVGVSPHRQDAYQHLRYYIIREVRQRQKK